MFCNAIPPVANGSNLNGGLELESSCFIILVLVLYSCSSFLGVALLLARSSVLRHSVQASKADSLMHLENLYCSLFPVVCLPDVCVRQLRSDERCELNQLGGVCVCRRPAIVDDSTKQAAVVDPVEPEKILRVAQENGVALKLVLTTHHHWWDHAGGNDKIKQLVPDIKIYGGSVDNVQGCTNKVENGDKFSLGVDINILSLHTPCHTKGHISYFVTGKDGEDPAVFTGDTLFVAGCGKFFEGTAEQMYQSLCVTLGSLPKPTQVYCGHEYTVKNLQFALTVEPENAKVSEKLKLAEQKRNEGVPTIPSSIEEELETNPFMRVDLPEVQEKVGCSSPVDALREIRQRKDNWRG
ncbi:hydroxyacylglutathione hydrolase cytoplasmic [Dorcoceras hygrometricum]|uniref:hydroxyacylglutathione hydrolase n=1 Tax=Dorcoceras hygrometricum TaxID=472368 RepID=A0A2Z7CE24_9LAMI|nr:hydroxyacylglutathione hydrolase cytoplasmic [Dorcoceras hygrometricum]